MAGGEYGNERHEAALRRDRIVELRDQGLTFREIAVEVGVSHQRVWQLYQRAMRDRPVVAVHEERKKQRLAAQLQRIDMEREVAEALVTSAHQVITVSGKVLEAEDSGPVLAAMDRLVKLDDQEAKLLGLYAEQKMAVSGGLRYEVVGIAPEDLT